ncbi:MAG: PEGA domain-containing protein [Candidatus Riflebacteria bacterium]|nr:PEGA domain-containing protein [Candidatus Riflebacteria bacterium]
MKRSNILIIILFFLFAVDDLSAASKPKINMTMFAGTPYDYVIVTPKKFASAFQVLADWKTAKGVPAKVVTTEEIYRNFRVGDSPSRIRDYLKAAFKAWNIKWVLLGGDTEDQHEELIPARYVTTFGPLIPSDLYYADFNGNWDGNGNGIFGEFSDNCDLIPEISIGRASVSTVEEAALFVNKVIIYEKSPPANWVNRASIVAFDLDQFTKGEDDARMLENEYFKGMELKRLYQSMKVLPDQIVSEISSFNPHFVYIGTHGFPKYFLTSSEKPFTTEHADKLKNSFPFVCIAMSCLTNYFDDDCLSEHFMNNPNGGAVAYWGYSREGRYQKNNAEYYFSMLLVKEFYNLIFKDSGTALNHIGDAASRARMKYVEQARKDSENFRFVIFSKNLLGDPEMPVWTSEPCEISAATEIIGNVLSVKITSNSKPVENALLCLEFGDEKSANLTITAKNKIPKTIQVSDLCISGLYKAALTDNKGEARIQLKENNLVIYSRIQELIQLNSQISELQESLKSLNSESPYFTLLSKNYVFKKLNLDRKHAEIGMYLSSLIKERRFSEVEKCLVFIEENLLQNPEAVCEFELVFKIIVDKLRFNLIDIQEDKSGIQRQIISKALELSSRIKYLENIEKNGYFGKIKVTSNPTGAEVFLDNIPIGCTPLTRENISPGNHILIIKNQGCESIKKEISIENNRLLSEDIVLKANCSISGKVKSAAGDILSDVRITVLKIADEGKKEPMVIIATGTSDELGDYNFLSLPKVNMVVKYEKDCYKMTWKPFLFSQPDQEFQRKFDPVLLSDSP